MNNTEDDDACPTTPEHKRARFTNDNPPERPIRPRQRPALQRNHHIEERRNLFPPIRPNLK